MSYTAEEILSKAKVRLVIHQPFFGAICLRFPLVKGAKGGTMETDGKYIYYDEEWTKKLTINQAAGVLAHECFHVAMLHVLRRSNRAPTKWNVACDFATNEYINGCGFDLPEGVVGAGSNNPEMQRLAIKYAGWSVEKIFDDLPDMPEDEVCEWGIVLDHPDKDNPSKAKEAETDIKGVVVQAANASKSKGKLPASIETLVNAYTKPQVDWRQQLRNELSGNVPDDWSYRKLQNMYAYFLSAVVPNLDNRGVGEIVVGVDSSGSVSQKEMAAFFSEMKVIHNDMMPEKTHVVWCDAAIQHVDVYEQGEIFDDNKRYGCGGTVLRPVFEWVENQYITPTTMVFFTDLCIWADDLKDIRPDYPVIWVSTDQDQAPFGKVIKINA